VFTLLIIARRVDIHSQTKNTIFNVYNYFKKLTNNHVNIKVVKYFRQAQHITADACGVSFSTVKKITTEDIKCIVNAKPEDEDSHSNPLFTSSWKKYK
jgi:hypothetical protein